jgi:hypothetical protein
VPDVHDVAPDAAPAGGTSARLFLVIARIFGLGLGPALGFGSKGAEQFFLGKLAMQHVLALLFHGGSGFGLVDLGVALEALDVVLAEIFGLELAAGDLAQRHDRVLIAVAVNKRLCAAGQLTSTMRGHENEIEAIRYLIDTIFNGNASHTDPHKGAGSLVK